MNVTDYCCCCKDSLEVIFWIRLQWHNIHAKFHENLFVIPPPVDGMRSSPTLERKANMKTGKRGLTSKRRSEFVLAVYICLHSVVVRAINFSSNAISIIQINV